MTKSTELSDKIAALIAKAKDKACTEAEAINTMRLAQKLADKHGLSLRDIENAAKAGEALQFSETGVASYPSDESKRHEIDLSYNRHGMFERSLSTNIGEYCGARFYREGTRSFFFGLDADVELAHYLRYTLRRTMDYEFHIFMKYSLEGKIRGARATFMQNFAYAMTGRLAAFTREAEKASGGASTALVIRKTELVEQELNNRGYSFSSGRASAQGNHADAAAAGADAGRRANVGRGMAGGNNTLQIGG